MSKQGILRAHKATIIYSQEDWNMLKAKRTRAKELLTLFNEEGLHPHVYGSVARGDVNLNSDIDIAFINQVPSYLIEFILYKNGFTQNFREIIVATPRDPIKLYLYLSELECISLPLSKLDKSSVEFYDFGGKLDLGGLKKNERLPGVDKRLVYIKPNAKGHEELSLINNQAMVAKDLAIHIDTVSERIAVLSRREKHGRTGVFLKRRLNINESVEDVLKKISKKNSIVRKKLR